MPQVHRLSGMGSGTNSKPPILSVDTSWCGAESGLMTHGMKHIADCVANDSHLISFSFVWCKDFVHGIVSNNGA